MGGPLAHYGVWGPLGAPYLTHVTPPIGGIVAAVIAEVARQDDKHGPYGSQGGSPLGISRLALATLEDEVAEALEAWREERFEPAWTHTREEVVQVAAVAIRTIRDALPEAPG